MLKNNNFFFISCSVSLILIVFFLVGDSKKVEVVPDRKEGFYKEDNKLSCNEIFNDKENLFFTVLKKEKDITEIELQDLVLNNQLNEENNALEAFIACVTSSESKFIINISDNKNINERLTRFIEISKRLNSKNKDVEKGHNKIKNKLILRTSFNQNQL